MGVYIKDFEPPKDCRECDESMLRLAIGCPYFEEDRVWACPLTEVCGGHGDLVDNNEVGEILTKALDACTDLYACEKDEILAAVWGAETVIEAEEK